MVACARGTSDRVTRGESHARTVAKGSRWSASPVGVDGLFSFSKHRALATEGLDTCTGLPLAVVSAAMPGMIPVPGGEQTPRGPSREILAAGAACSRASRVCEGLGRGRLTLSRRRRGCRVKSKKSSKSNDEVRSQTTQRDRGARDACLEAPAPASRKFAGPRPVTRSAVGCIARDAGRTASATASSTLIRNGYITPEGPSGQTWKGPRSRSTTTTA